jgi:hypothetical protein
MTDADMRNLARDLIPDPHPDDRATGILVVHVEGLRSAVAARLAEVYAAGREDGQREYAAFGLVGPVIVTRRI